MVIVFQENVEKFIIELRNRAFSRDSLARYRKSSRKDREVAKERSRRPPLISKKCKDESTVSVVSGCSRDIRSAALDSER